MPWLYHHYIGHDNNRDWYMLTQKETQALNARHLPRVVPAGLARRAPDGHDRSADLHRRRSPILSTPTIHPLIWREVNLIGSNMALRLEQPARAA